MNLFPNLSLEKLSKVCLVGALVSIASPVLAKYFLAGALFVAASDMVSRQK
ncbi:MAG: hypothetical protein FWG80_01290 [Alphaproteobacteria bacterium]|nr:hypothetical protein [Alphaproteobacteria bacterium]